MDTKKPVFHSKTLTCLMCGKPFLYTISEAEYFWSRQLSEPKRCAPCRLLRRQRTIPDTGEARDGK